MIIFNNMLQITYIRVTSCFHFLARPKILWMKESQRSLYCNLILRELSITHLVPCERMNTLSTCELVFLGNDKLFVIIIRHHPQENEEMNHVRASRQRSKKKKEEKISRRLGVVKHHQFEESYTFDYE